MDCNRKDEWCRENRSVEVQKKENWRVRKTGSGGDLRLKVSIFIFFIFIFIRLSVRQLPSALISIATTLDNAFLPNTQCPQPHSFLIARCWSQKIYNGYGDKVSTSAGPEALELEYGRHVSDWGESDRCPGSIQISPIVEVFSCFMHGMGPQAQVLSVMRCLVTVHICYAFKFTFGFK